MNSKKIINWTNEKINCNDYNSKFERAINEPIDEELKKICNELSLN
ncbi:MAG: hypothetical protein LBJ97_04375 [Mycoplasmataceae bacterium]|nr:hypothetical protein [Mycoplasmataceae bacterium]